MDLRLNGSEHAGYLRSGGEGMRRFIDSYQVNIHDPAYSSAKIDAATLNSRRERTGSGFQNRPSQANTIGLDQSTNTDPVTD